jgi:hypothetical protein
MFTERGLLPAPLSDRHQGGPVGGKEGTETTHRT